MARARRLALRGRGTTHPNPMVGAVLVKDGKVVGEGWHRRPGEAHAEVHAIDQAGHSARGSTLYVNLEPCVHQGRTPPCVEAILAAGIRKVVSSVEDPNPLVAGEGFRKLRENGVDVTVGEGREQALELNRAFFHFIRERTPYVTVKLASTMDGRIAAQDGSSRWITGERARRAVHRIRAESDAVLVGAGTVAADDPLLTARGTGRKVQPLRIVLDPDLRSPAGSRIFRNGGDGRTVLIAADGLPAERYAEREGIGARIIRLPTEKGLFTWADLARELVALDVLHLMVEGGGATAAWFLQQGVVRRIELFVAPKFLGSEGVPSVGDLGIESLAGARTFTLRRCRRIGNDVRLTVDALQDPV